MRGMDPKDGIRIHTKLEDARHLARARRWADAEGLLREILAEVPGHVSARNVLALACLQQGRTEEAEKEYGESLAVEPRQYRVLHMLGCLNLERGDLDEAERFHRQSLELAPGFVEGWVHLGFLAVQRGREPEAREWFQKALAAEPDSPRTRQTIADLYFKEEDYANARTYYEEALEMTPHHFTAMVQAGVCSLRLGDYEAAADFFQRAQLIQPDAWIPPYNLACAQALANNIAPALESLEKAAERCETPANMAALLKEDPDLASLRNREEFRALSRRLLGAASAPGNSAQTGGGNEGTVPPEGLR